MAKGRRDGVAPRRRTLRPPAQPPGHPARPRLDQPGAAGAEGVIAFRVAEPFEAGEGRGEGGVVGGREELVAACGDEQKWPRDQRAEVPGEVLQAPPLREEI